MSCFALTRPTVPSIKQPVGGHSPERQAASPCQQPTRADLTTNPRRSLIPSLLRTPPIAPEPPPKRSTPKFSIPEGVHPMPKVVSDKQHTVNRKHADESTDSRASSFASGKCHAVTPRKKPFCETNPFCSTRGKNASNPNRGISIMREKSSGTDPVPNTNGDTESNHVTAIVTGQSWLDRSAGNPKDNARRCRTVSCPPPRPAA